MTAPERPGSALRAIHREIVEMDAVDMAARLTLVYLLLYPVWEGWPRLAIRAVTLTGLLSPSLARHPLPWGVIAALQGWRLLGNWETADNHIYLQTYWCFAFFCALCARDVRGTLVTNARVLIGLAFAFATLWKVVLSPDFLDGSFMRVTLLQDARFYELSLLAGGMTSEMDERNVELLDSLDYAEEGSAVTLEQPPRLVALATAMTWWTVLVEAGIAITFLAPLGRLGSFLRHPLLLGFTWGTYAIATVAGFGWLLMVMGATQCEARQHRTRLLYLGTFVLILFYREAPWLEGLKSWLLPDG